jgi:hypothetical protein
MLHDLPPHLEALAASRVPAAHTWSQSVAMVALGKETPALLDNVGKLSMRAVVGLQAALGEWVAQRFAHLSADTGLAQVNEALWAASIDCRYLNLNAMDFPEASGPIDGPMREVKLSSAGIADYYRDVDFGVVRWTITTANLVKFVLPDSKAFKTWFKAVVPRVASLSSPSAREASALSPAEKKTPPKGIPTAIFGSPVPREAFDPTFDLSAADSGALIDAMLVQIATTPNPYLYSAAELTKAGFPGTPFRYHP